MALLPGVRLGPYEIVAPLGAGGMGEVYRAIDRRLNRSVAIKLVAERHRDRPDLHERFKIEMTAIAALNHPHICQLYDVGEHGGTNYLVMELVEGETLAARLARGRLPLEDALRIAREIADALDWAHRSGILHRDLKPANVMCTRTGVKLLDFGVARVRRLDQAAAAALSTVAPRGAPLTEAGTPLGTWQYMAPEQIRGGQADARTDIFALGAVMYEMLVGRRPFAAATHAELVAAILESDPGSLTAANAAVTPTLDRIVRTSLAKNPDDRWQSAGDLRRALETSVVSEEGTAPASRRSRLLWAAVSGGIVVAAVAGAMMGRSTRAANTSSEARLVRSTLQVSSAIVAGAGAVALSPDGETLVYVSRELESGRRPALSVRRLDSGASLTIEGAIGVAPFFSPDGQWVGFCDRSRLLKIPLAGGRPTPLANVQTCYGASWGEDGHIVYSPGPEVGLRRVAAAGGESTEVTRLLPEDAGNDHRWPQVLPGGRGILFTVGTGPEDDARIVVLDARTGARKELLRGSASARYVPTGHLVYARNGELRALPFDLEHLEATGSPVKIADGVMEWTNGAPEYSFAATGELVFVPGQSGGPRNRLVLVNFSGAVEPLNLPPAPYAYPRVSPDGTRIAVMRGGAKNNVWMYHLVRGNAAPVTAGRYHNPVWFPDGRLMMAQGGEGNHRLVRRAGDGSGDDEPLTSPQTALYPEAVSPDGTLVIYRSRIDSYAALYALQPATGAVRQLTAPRVNAYQARLSPDGRWLAYVSDETGRLQAYIRARSGEAREMVSVDGAHFVAWAPDGRRLFYRDIPPGPMGASAFSPGRIWGVDVEVNPRLRVSRPRLVLAAEGLGGDFDVLPDGDRFVMIQVDNTPPPERLELVQNWMRLVSGAPTR